MNRHVFLKTVTTKLLGIVCFGLIIIMSGCGGGGNDSSAPDNNGNNDTSLSNAELIVSGIITGNNASVTLSLNGIQEVFSGSTFTFSKKLNVDDFYSVSFVSTSDSKDCLVSNAGGIITTDVSDIVITCFDSIVTEPPPVLNTPN